MMWTDSRSHVLEKQRCNHLRRHLALHNRRYLADAWILYRVLLEVRRGVEVVR
jgi:hypothetical protein